MMTLSTAILQFFQARQAERISQNTLSDYQYTYRRFMGWIGSDPLIGHIDAATIRAFMASTGNVSKKTALNYHIGLSSLWTWMVSTGLVDHNIVRQVRPPKAETREIIPYNRDEIMALLQASAEGRQTERNRAVILTLLDTGVRATEICELRMRDLSLSARSILVFGKGSKERRLRISAPTSDTIQGYLEVKPSHRMLYLTEQNQPCNRHMIRKMLERVGLRAGVPDVTAHRFRHTFAIESLRNGMNIYALQKALGHTTLDMVKRYLALVQADLDNQMDLSSPVVKWQLGSHP